MSKRFGRNQRRKLSQQLAAQQAETDRFSKAYQMAEGLARHASRELAQATHDLKVLYHEVGKNLNTGHPLLPDHMRRQLDVESAAQVRVRIPSEQMTIRMVDVLRKGIVTDEFKNRVAIRLAHGDKTVGYAVDVKSLQTVSFRDEYIDELSRDIARYLVDALTEQGGENHD